VIFVIRLPESAASRRAAAFLAAMARPRFGKAVRGALAGLLLCAGAANVNLARPQDPFIQAANPPDPRAERLRAFFRAYHCPEPHHVEAYLRAADRYGLDYRLLPAISVRETTCGWNEKNNNFWGYHPGRQSFASVESGIEFLARQLAINPPYAGKDIVEKLFTYNPRRAYADEVRRIMRQIE